MSFVRIPHRSHSMSSLNSSRARKKKPKANKAWDDSVTDLTQHRATREEIEHRRNSHKSNNLEVIRLEKQEKKIAKARKHQNQSVETGDHSNSRLLREILYDQSQLQDALSHSDRVMSVVQDLFGDDPKRNVAFPHVTLAPGQKSSGQRPRGPITEAPETPSRLTTLSESVMNHQALNDMEDDDDEDSITDSDKEKENQPVSFPGTMDMDRFQDFIKRQLVNQSSRPYDNTQSSLSQDTGRIRRNTDKMTPTKEYPSFVSSENADISANSATVAGGAINDTVKVKKKSRSRVSKERRKKEDDEKHKAAAHAEDLSMVLRGLEQEMIDYEVATGRRSTDESIAAGGGNTSHLSYNVPGVSGYTTLLVQTIAKLIGYLKETETRWIDEKKVRDNLQERLAEQRILIDAITADLLATQDLQLRTQQELNHYMTHTQAQLTNIQESLSSIGLQHSQTPSASTESHIASKRPVHTDPTTNDMRHPVPSEPYPQHRIPTSTTMATTSHSTAVPPSHLHFTMPSNTGPYPQDQKPGDLTKTHTISHYTAVPPKHFPFTMPSNTEAYRQDRIPRGMTPSGQMTSSHPIATTTSHRLPIGMTTSHSGGTIPSGQMTASHPIATAISHPGAAATSTSLSMPVNRAQYHPHTETISEQFDQRAVVAKNSQQTPNTAKQSTNDEQDLADELYTALHTATKTSKTAYQMNPTMPGINTNHTHGQHPQVPTQVRSDTQPISIQNPAESHPQLSQFSSSFLEDKRHLGTRDASRMTFQPAVLLSPPRQRDRSTLARSRLATVGAYPMSRSDGTAIGTNHSVDRGPSLAKGDLSVRIAELSKQHEQAQDRLKQLKTLSGGEKDAVTHNGEDYKTQPVSPPISPITTEPPQLKHVVRGSSHLAKEGRTIHVSLPRAEALEISATSTPSPKTAENKNKARYSNTSLSSQQWKTPEKYDESTQEDQFFALSAHLST